MNNNFRYYKITATIITGMGPEESGVPNNDWVPPDDNPPNVTVHALPPISGKGKVRSMAVILNRL